MGIYGQGFCWPVAKRTMDRIAKGRLWMGETCSALGSLQQTLVQETTLRPVALGRCRAREASLLISQRDQDEIDAKDAGNVVWW